jgi:hypothetical protein
MPVDQDQSQENKKQDWKMKEQEACGTAGKFEESPFPPVGGVNFVIDEQHGISQIEPQERISH